jgi:hypothetical protein
MTIRPLLAVVTACAVLFGASYAAARLTNDGDVGRAQPSETAPAPTAPAGRELALSRSATLPALRKPPKPAPRPVSSVPDQGPAPAPLSPSPSPQRVSTESEPDDGGANAPAENPPEGGQTFDSDGSTPTQPSPPQPAPEQTSAPTDFYDEGG